MRKNGATKNGKTTVEYMTWQNIRKRCDDPRNPNYGGKGIRVCDRWRDSFVAFLEDMGERPAHCDSIERIDSDGNYEPSNCRWATRVEQNNNTKRNRLVTVGGETLTIAQWAARFSVHKNRIYTRINRDGWDPVAAITTPFHSPPQISGSCRRGHPWTKENQYTRPDTGKQSCLPCVRIRNARRSKKHADR